MEWKIFWKISCFWLAFCPFRNGAKVNLMNVSVFFYLKSIWEFISKNKCRCKQIRERVNFSSWENPNYKINYNEAGLFKGILPVNIRFIEEKNPRTQSSVMPPEVRASQEPLWPPSKGEEGGRGDFRCGYQFPAEIRPFIWNFIEIDRLDQKVAFTPQSPTPRSFWLPWKITIFILQIETL